MTNKELISTIQQLKEVRPSAEWRRFVRNELLSVAVSREMMAKKAAPAFNWQMVFGRVLPSGRQVWQPAFGALALILAVAIGAAIFIFSPKTGGNVAYNSPTPKSQVEPMINFSAMSETEIVDKNLVDEKNDMLQYDYKLEEQIVEPKTEETRLVSNNEIIRKEAGYNQKQVEENNFEADFKVGLIKERGYNDKVIGGFLMAGEGENK